MVALLLNVSGKVLKYPTSGDELLGLRKRRKPTRSKSAERFLAKIAKEGQRTLADYEAEHGIS